MSGNAEYVDVDQSWDGKGSLDDHRQAAFDTMEQVPFGTAQPKPAEADTQIALTPAAEEVSDVELAE